MTTLDTMTLPNIRKETDSLGEVDVPAHVLWGAQTQRSLEHFSIGHDLIPREMIAAYAMLKNAAANVNHAAGRRVQRPKLAFVLLESQRLGSALRALCLAGCALRRVARPQKLVRLFIDPEK
jgi:hypothetical protein